MLEIVKDSADFDPSRLVHMACAYSSRDSLEVITFLADEFPESVKSADDLEQTPMHVLCTYNNNLDALPIFGFLLDRHPEILASGDSTPLHKIFRHQEWDSESTVDLAVLQMLIEAYPEALTIKDERECTPLHWACHRDWVEVPMDVIGLLADHSHAILESVEEVNTPLHIVCSQDRSFYSMNQNCLELLEVLAVSKAAVKARNENGETGLHLLCQEGAPRDACQVLLKKFQGLVCEKDNQGRIPLHKAVEGSLGTTTPEELAPYCTIVKFLLQKFAGGVQEEDNDGITPLELARSEGASLSIIYELVRVDPMANLGLETGS